MARLKKRHILLGQKAFAMNLKSGGNTGASHPERHVSREMHNLNCKNFMEYLDSVKLRKAPSLELRKRIAETKALLGYGYDASTWDDDVEHALVAPTQIFNADEYYDFQTADKKISPADKKITEKIDLLKRQIKRLQYVHGLTDPEKTKTTKFISKGSAYGVEIECYLPLNLLSITSNKYRCLNCVSCPDEQICTRDPSSYIDDFRKYFRPIFKDRGIKNVELVNDGSLDSNGDEGELSLYTGVEFRVLCDIRDNFKNLEKLCNLLTEVGAKVDNSCGLHVHLDTRDMDLPTYLQSLERLNNSLFGLKMILPKSRNENYYCNTKTFNLPKLNTYDCDDYCESDDVVMRGYLPEYIDLITSRAGLLDVGPDSSTVTEIFKQHDADELKELYGTLLKRLPSMTLIDSKYAAINAHCFKKYRTIEVRLHSGTTQFNKIANWINILNLIVVSEYFDSDNATFKNTMKLKNIHILDFVNMLNLDKSEVSQMVANYIIERHNKFNTINDVILDVTSAAPELADQPEPPVTGRRNRMRNNLRVRGERTEPLIDEVTTNRFHELAATVLPEVQEVVRSRPTEETRSVNASAVNTYLSNFMTSDAFLRIQDLIQTRDVSEAPTPTDVGNAIHNYILHGDDNLITTPEDETEYFAVVPPAPPSEDIPF